MYVLCVEKSTFFIARDARPAHITVSIAQKPGFVHKNFFASFDSSEKIRQKRKKELRGGAIFAIIYA